MIAIIDYDAGNLKSVEKAFQFIGADVKVTSNKKIIDDAKAVVLPGVGAFADCIKSLRSKAMDQEVLKAIKKGKPFLGICLGFQMLFDYSEEFSIDGKNEEGLKVIQGGVKQFPQNMGLKVPHMGWNSIKYNQNCPLFKGLPEKSYVYFVHSYYVDCEDSQAISAKTDYGIEFHSAVYKDNIFATQFHPEKSGEIGIKMLKNFIELT